MYVVEVSRCPRSADLSGKQNFSLVCRLKIPWLPTHGAVRGFVLSFSPLFDAVNVEGVGAFSSDDGAILSRDLANRATRVKQLPADSACILVLHIPGPLSHKMRRDDFDVHSVWAYQCLLMRNRCSERTMIAMTVCRVSTTIRATRIGDSQRKRCFGKRKKRKKNGDTGLYRASVLLSRGLGDYNTDIIRENPHIRL
jgi:hypothetical protein